MLKSNKLFVLSMLSFTLEVAVLSHRGRAGRVIHRANMLDDDVTALYGVVDGAQVGADVARARRQVLLAQLHDDAHVVTVDHAGRQRGAEHESAKTAEREQVPGQQDERGELGLERRGYRRLLRLRKRVDGGAGGGDASPGPRLAEAGHGPVHLAAV